MSDLSDNCVVDGISTGGKHCVTSWTISADTAAALTASTV